MHTAKEMTNGRRLTYVLFEGGKGLRAAEMKDPKPSSNGGCSRLPAGTTL